MASGIASQATKLDLTSDRVEQIASQGLKDPSTLRPDDVKQLCGAVMAFIDGARKRE